MSETIRKVLIFHAGGLGDCVLTIQLARELSRHIEFAKITIAARSTIARWASHHGLIADARSLDSLHLHRLLGSDRDWPVETADYVQSFDRVISFLGPPEEEISMRLREHLGDRLVAIDPRPRESTLREGRHITEQWLEDLAQNDVDLPRTISTAHLASSLDREKARDRLRRRMGCDGQAAIVLVHPGSGGLAKCCPLEAMESLVECLRDHKDSAVWMVGPDEWERWGGEFVQRLERGAPVLFEEDVSAAADDLLGAVAYVGNDAGMTHVAALTGLRTVALFGPTDPRVWRPLGPDCTITTFPSTATSLPEWVIHVSSIVSRSETQEGSLP